MSIKKILAGQHMVGVALTVKCKFRAYFFSRPLVLGANRPATKILQEKVCG